MPAAESLRQLAHDYWEGVLRRNPTFATFIGDNRFDDRLPDVGPDGRADEAAALQDVLRRLDAIVPSELSTDDVVTWDMLGLSARSGLDAIRLRLDEMAVDQMDGPQVWLMEMLNWQPTDTPEAREKLVARYRAFPAYMGQYLGNLEDGAREGRTSPRLAVERVVAQLRATLDTPPDRSVLALPEKNLPGDDVRPLVEAVETSVYPSFARLFEYLEGSYLERFARSEPGVWTVTDGDEIYATLVRQHTTTDLRPDELHRIGLEELEQIHAEMRAIMARLGDRSGDIRAFAGRLTADPRNLPRTREEIVQAAEAHLQRAYEALPRAFGQLPSIPCIVRPIEEYRERDAVAAFYYPPSEDGSRPGIFYVNTFDPPSRPRHTLPALVFHEGVPGHHLQIARAQQESYLPAFRRLSAGWLANAFVEGWALYTERLADELGLYPDNLARFGMLGYQAWRACRLVVDTGMHHLHWTRQRAVDFFSENVGLTERETVNEVDRYVIWPAQALSYKTGQREIESARREAERRLSGKFDPRAFHDELLGHGAVPLSTLRKTMHGWADRQAS